MKTFGKILGWVLLIIVILAVCVNLYFTDERLKNTVLPYLNDAVGKPVQVDRMSLSFFSTFPQPGISITNLRVHGEQPEEELLSLDELTAGVELFPLFNSQLNITQLVLNNPRFIYEIKADSTTNLDFLFESDEPADTTSAGYNVNIPYFEINNGYLGYRDRTANTFVLGDDVDGSLSLSYADSIASSIDVQVQRFSAEVDSSTYISGLPMRLTEESTLYPDRELLKLQEGTFNIRGLAMDLTGALSNWSDAFTVDLTVQSSSDNFGDLLQMLPQNEYTQGLESRGRLDLGGTVKGVITQDTLPRFDLRLGVTDGYLKDPDLPQPIEDIQLTANATNDSLTVQTLSAKAGANSINGSGRLNRPLEEDADFNVDFVADVDLSTVDQFYSLAELGVEQLAGQLDIDANTRGRLSEVEKAAFNGKAVLANGRLKYADVAEPITNIAINASGSQELLTLQNASLQAGTNSFSAKGQIQNLLDEANRRINNMNANLRFNLATLKNFYPIDEDTLRMEGMLTAQAVLNGPARQIERAVQSGSINLSNGLIDYEELDAPLRNITLESVLQGPQMTIVNASLASGENNLKAGGTINNYLSENRTVNLKTQGNMRLSELSNYVTLAPDIQNMSGDATFNLNVSGPLAEVANMAFSGDLVMKNANMEGDAFPQPVKDLNGTFTLSPDRASLEQLTLQLGSSDMQITGALTNYMQYLREESARTRRPELTGTYRSRYLDLDELIDWSDTTSTFTLELPNLNSSLSASIDQMKITGVTMRNLQARATSTPEAINMSEARLELFEGKASGTMNWKIPKNQPSTFNFKGQLDSLRLESFFRDFPILGEDSDFYKYITGTFSTAVDYTTKITPDLEPLIATTLLNGNFGMSQSRISNHPLQQKIASYAKINALKDVALDQWQSKVAVSDNVLTLTDLSLTSGDIGMRLNGTQNLMNDNIDFSIAVLLPERFKSTIGSVITAQAANALTQQNGTVMVPLRVTGNYSNPTVQPDQTVIKPMVESFLKNKASSTIKNLFGRGNDKKQAADSTAQQPPATADTTGQNQHQPT